MLDNNKYREEIDGLRAIAVLSVIFYHTKINVFEKVIFKNGFLGVDIFFVISGFLITRILIQSIIEKKINIILNFYVRRIKRILPVLLLIILIFMPLGWLYLTPNFYIDFSKSILTSLGFISNIYFLYSSQNYGAVSSEYIPFLHTWSLSVEEQFYLFYPIFLIVVYSYFKKFFLPSLIILFLISLGTSEYLSSTYPNHNFFLLPSRLWQIMIGSIVAVYSYDKDNTVNSKIFSNFILFLSLLFMLIPILFFGNNNISLIGKFHPSFSFLSILPTIGAGLFILYSKKNLFFTKLISNKILVFFGLISYSLYLWHYPILAFNKIIKFYDDTIFLNKAIYFLIIILLSYLSYNIIEKPFRKKFSNKISLSLIFFQIIIILIISLFIIKNNGYEHRYKNLKVSFPKFEIDNRKLQEKRYIKLEELRNKQTIKNFKNNVLLLGDSHADDLFLSFSLNNELFPSYNFISKNLENFEKDINSSKKYIDKLEIIILVLRWHEYSYTEITEIFKKIQRIKNDNLNIIIASNKTEFLANQLYTIIDYKIFTKDFQKKINTFKKDYFLNRTIKSSSPINSYLQKITKTFNFNFFNQEEIACNIKKETCEYLTPNDYKKLYYDYGHFTLDGAKYFGKKLYLLKILNLN